MFSKGFKFAILAVAGLTTACANYDLDMVKAMPGSGSPFKDALQREYVKVAADEDYEHDIVDAKFFAEKATMAAKGMDVGPQEVGERMIPNANKKELSFARSGLMNALADMDKVGNIHALARAQAQFDCWLQEQEENNQPDDIAKCRLAFEKSMSLLNMAKAAPAPKPMMKMKKMAKMMEAMVFVVYFDHDSAKLSMESGRTIGKAIMAISHSKPKTVQVGGHADTSGDITYNNALSDRRAKAVANLLKSGGFGKKLIKSSMFGEDFTAVATGDGVKNGKNRRVEIKLKY